MDEVDIDCDGTDDIVCPYCGHVFGDSWEFNFGPSEQSEIECSNDSCALTFDACRDISVTYSTYRKEE